MRRQLIYFLDSINQVRSVIQTEMLSLRYYKYFLGKPHTNYVGMDSEGSAYVLSLLEERSFGQTQCRAILWTRDGPKRLCLRQGPFGAKHVLAHFGGISGVTRVDKQPKEVSLEEQRLKSSLKLWNGQRTVKWMFNAGACITWLDVEKELQSPSKT